MTRYCLDSSVAVHALQGNLAAASWFDAVTEDPDSEVVASRILRTELTRVLRRLGRPVAERELIVDHLGIVPVTEGVLTAAEAITEHVKTLDAIHLATAVVLGGDTVVVSHDRQVLRVAGLLGLRVADPVVGGEA